MSTTWGRTPAKTLNITGRHGLILVVISISFLFNTKGKKKVKLSFTYTQKSPSPNSMSKQSRKTEKYQNTNHFKSLATIYVKQGKLLMGTGGTIEGRPYAASGKIPVSLVNVISTRALWPPLQIHTQFHYLVTLRGSPKQLLLSGDTTSFW